MKDEWFKMNYVLSIRYNGYQKYLYTVLVIIESIYLLNTSLIPIKRKTATNLSFARIKM